MTFAVVQKDASPLPLELVTQALCSVPIFAPADAAMIARDCQGIIARHLSQEHACTIQRTLQAGGVDAEVTDDSHLPPLPQPRGMKRVDIGDDKLTVYDQLGRFATADWPAVKMIAAGEVSVTELKRTVDEYKTFSPARAVTMGPFAATQRSIDISYHEDPHYRLVIEIHLPGDLRFRALGHEFAYGRPRDRSQRAVWQNFATLIQELAAKATRASLNKGAAAIATDGTLVRYNARKLFEQEMIWLLWRAGATQ